jgi:SAM-dependent methyltransferase
MVVFAPTFPCPADAVAAPLVRRSVGAVRLHHVGAADQAVILGEVRRTLRPGGVFVLAEDTPRTAYEWANAIRADERLNFEPAAAPHNYRRVDDWRSMLPTHGLSVEDEVAFIWLCPPGHTGAVQHWVFICRRR